MSPDAISALDSGGLASLLLVLRPSKLLSFTVIGIFEDFIEQLLPFCGKWPEPKSVLVMDKASFHHTERLDVS
jgi:hypothetical protein